MDTRSFIDAKIAAKPILLIGKSCDSLTKYVEKYINDNGIARSRPGFFETLYIDGRQDVSVIDTYIYQKWLTKCRTAPHLFINGIYIGGGMDLITQIRQGILERILNSIFE
ncbi:unnamed protein product [Rodentolepis nana]|uniref:Glutaredoxin domain-containing protein n=1 Tax=Rodentolepis nana TaxID=102285 RepID=A0A0R3TRD7_RODNA|nr:unnamed protein product [Rodentolepis nana]